MLRVLILWGEFVWRQLVWLAIQGSAGAAADDTQHTLGGMLLMFLLFYLALSLSLSLSLYRSLSLSLSLFLSFLIVFFEVWETFGYDVGIVSLMGPDLDRTCRSIFSPISRSSLHSSEISKTTRNLKNVLQGLDLEITMSEKSRDHFK